MATLRRPGLLFLICIIPCLSAQIFAAEESLFDLSLEELMRLEITTAGKRPEKILDIPANISIITRKDIETYGYGSLTEVLEHATNIYNIDNYEGISGNFGIRGAWNGRSQNSSTAILVNGKLQTRVDERSNPLTKIAVPIEAIDRVEIIKGPMSTLYGNGASNGVINIVTNEFTPLDRHLISARTSSGRNTESVFTRHTFGYENKGLVTNIGFTKSDGPDYAIKDMVSSATLADLPGLGISAPDNYRFEDLLEKTKSYAEISGWWNDWTLDLTWQETKIERFVLIPPVQNGSSLETNNIEASLQRKLILNDSTTVDTRLLYNHYRHFQDFDGLAPGILAENNLRYRAYEFESNLNLTPREYLGIVAGIDYQVMRNYGEFTSAPSFGFVNESVQIEKRVSKALFTQATLSLNDQLKLITGYRFEKIDMHDRMGIENGGTPSEDTFGGPQGGQISRSPRIAVIYHLHDHHTFKAMYGQANQITNDRFGPERTITSEINYVFAEKDTLINASLFHSKNRDLVVDELTLNPDNSVSNKTTQQGAKTVIGAEVEASFPLSARLNTEIGLGWQEAKDDIHSDILPAYTPTWVLHSRLSYKQKHTTLSVLARFVDTMRSYFDPTIDLGGGQFGARIGIDSGSYTVVDLNFRQDRIFGNGYINFKIKNFFNEIIHYPNNQFNNELLDEGTIGEERQFVFTLGFSL